MIMWFWLAVNVTGCSKAVKLGTVPLSGQKAL